MHSELKRRICIASLITITSITTLLPLNSACAEQFFTREFKWSYKGSTWTLTSEIPKSLYDEYSQVSLQQRTGRGTAGYDFLITTQDYKMRSIADSLRKAASEKGYGSYDEVSFILAFVQCLPYTSDSVTTGHDEYPRFPIETLVDGGGDCEDTSILFATIVRILDYSAILIAPPNHVAVGVLGTSLSGTYYKYNGKNYYYCETTGSNWKIGDVPNAHKNVKAYLYPINLGNQYQPGTYAMAQLWLPILLIVGLVVLLFGVVYVLTRPKEIPTPPVLSTATRYCPSCGYIVPEKAHYCPYCGKELR